VVETLQSFLVEPFRDSVTDIFVAVVVQAANNFNATETYIEVADTAITALKEA